jgi:twinkle protein
MDLNGFEIDEFNIYNIDTKAKVSTCPKCSHTRKKKTQKCVMLDWDRGLGSCQHCGEVIQLHTYKKGSASALYEKPKALDYKPLSSGVVKYFSDRGISQETLRSFKITDGKEFMPQEGKEMGVILFNYFVHGELTNVKYRDAKKNFKMYKGAQKTFYNIDSIFKTDTCVIVEGEVDALSFHEAGVTNVVSVPNGFNLKGQINLDYLTEFYRFFEDKDRIYLAVDNDEAGKKGEAEFIRRFGSDKIWLVDFKDCKDANEYLIKYGKDELNKVLQSAQPCPIENVRRVSDMEGELDSFYKNGVENGYKIGLSDFDGIFSTYTKQFIVVTGFPSSGKSDFVDQMTVGYNMMYGWKTAYASVENFPQYLHVDKLIRKYYGSQVKYEDTKKKSFKDCMRHVNNNFFFMDFEKGFDLDTVLRKGEELVKRMGIRVLVIDPYNKVKDKENINLGINDYTNAYLNKIDNFCKKNDVLVLLIAHPNKPQNDKGKLLEPTFYDVKGGGEFYDMSPHGILVHRDYDEGTVKIKVLKVKFSNLGENQAHVNFYYNVNNGRYTRIEAGQPKWDNDNWLEETNPYEQTKMLDIEFAKLNDAF